MEQCGGAFPPHRTPSSSLIPAGGLRIHLSSDTVCKEIGPDSTVHGFNPTRLTTPPLWMAVTSPRLLPIHHSLWRKTARQKALGMGVQWANLLWYEFCVPQNSYIAILILNVISLGGAFKKDLREESLINEIIALVRDPPETSHLSHHVRTQWQVCNQKSAFSWPSRHPNFQNCDG